VGETVPLAAARVAAQVSFPRTARGVVLGAALLGVGALGLAGLALLASVDLAHAQDGGRRRHRGGGGQTPAQSADTQRADTQAADAARSAAHDAEARALFQAGSVAFSEGRFTEALERYKRAFELSGRPEMHYNIAAAFDRAGLEAEALGAYERYLQSVPAAANRSFVEARIAVLRPRVEAARATAAGARGGDAASDTSGRDPASGAASAPSGAGAVGDDATADGAGGDADAPRSGADAASDAPARGGSALPGILLLAGGGALGAAAVVTGVLALGAKSDLDAGCVQGVCDASLRGRADDMRTFALLTDILGGLGIAAAVGGVVYLVFAGGRAAENAATAPPLRRVVLAPAVGRGLAGLSLAASF
jgi:tetratricopeptide (TPR) repeat protein